MKRTISVVGSASVDVEPDSARLSCGVMVTGANAQDALRRSNSAMQAIVDAVRSAGVAGADLRTNGPNLYPTESGYNGSNDVTVIVRDVSQVGAVIDAVAEAGGPNLTMHGVTFSVSDPHPHLQAARVAAIGSARAIADQLAGAAGAAVGDVLTIDETAGSHAPVAAGRAAMKMMATPVEPGTHTIGVEVAVTFRLVSPDT
jgi:uncharacterized protein YggE